MGRKRLDDRTALGDGAQMGQRESQLPPLGWLRGFEAAARLGSFTAAAQALGLSQAAVSYQIRSLEHHLGLSLFERQAHGVVLTDLGRAYLPSVQRAFDEIATATDGLFGARGETSLVIRTHPSFAALWLAPRLASFRTAYPRIQLRLYSSIWGNAVPAEEVDVEVRFGTGNWSGFEAEPIDDGPLMAVGRPGRDAAPVAELHKETLIEIMEVDDAWTVLFAAAGLPPPKREQIIRVDSALIALELVAVGVGNAIVFRSLAQPYLTANRVSDLRVPDRQARMAHYILRPLARQREKSEARLFTLWLKNELKHDHDSRAAL
ncbi:MAG: LysR family transcriptional regulator [Pararhodobacter sp.]|nr:LysR family transcriptional regulator [Pararhodobacter sp.]